MPFLKPLKTSVTKSRIDACKRNGLRHAIFAPGLSSRYTGEWKDDKRHGKGSAMRREFLYEGEWSSDSRHGYGLLSRVLEDKTRVKIYSGNWVEGKKQGFGMMLYKNGDYYEGGFSRNKREGFGRLWGSDGTFYQGTWKNDLCHGNGLLLEGNGNRYEGHFASGKKEGPGIFYHMRTGQSQEGCWIADKCLVSTMQDMYQRQSATTPTPYPIPKSEIGCSKEIFRTRMEEVSTLFDPEIRSYSTKFEDYTRGNIDCRQQLNSRAI